MSVKEGVERMKKFLLRPLFTAEKLNVVNQKNVGQAITFPEFYQITMLYRVDELVDEQLTRDVKHLHVFPFGPDELADGLHQMGLAQADASVNEQRIVRSRRRLRDGETGCVRDFIVRADDERFKRVPRIESGNGCGWSCLYVCAQRFFCRRRIVRRRLCAGCRRRGQPYQARTVKSRDDRILQCGHVITLDPELVNIVWNTKLDRLLL